MFMLTKESKEFLKEVYELDDEKYTENEIEELTKVIVKHNKKKVDLIETKLNIIEKLEKKEK